MALGQDVVELVARLKDELSGPLERVDQRFQRLATSIKRGALIISAAFTAVVANSVRLASSFGEVESKFGVVFGEYAPRARGELDSLADSIGRSSNRMLEFASLFQDTLVPLGYTRDAAASLSVQLVELATDLSSFNNIPTAQVAADLQTAMVGNTEVLRKYGVVAQELQIKEYALNNGLWDGVGAMTAQNKAAAILGLTIAGTSDAQGDAARTADSFANQTRSLMDQLYDLQVNLGNQLIPLLSEAGEDMIPRLTEALESAIPTVVDLVEKILELAVEALPAVIATVETVMPVLAGLVSIVARAATGWAALMNEFSGTTGTIDLLKDGLKDTRDLLIDAVESGFMSSEEAAAQFDEQVRTLIETVDLTGAEIIQLAGSAGQFSDEIGEASLAVDVYISKLTGMSKGNYEVAISQAVLQRTFAQSMGWDTVAEQMDEVIANLKTMYGQANATIDALEGSGSSAGTSSGTGSETKAAGDLQGKFDDIRATREETLALEEQIQEKMDAQIESARAAREEEIAHQDQIDAKIAKMADAQAQALANFNDKMLSGAQAVGRQMLSGAEDWEEKMLLAVLKIGIEMGLNFILPGLGSFVGGILPFRTGGTVRHARTGETVPDAGHYGDRHLYMLERGERVIPREQSLSGMGMQGGSVSLSLSINSMFSSASKTELLKAADIMVSALKTRGVSIG